MTKGAGRNQDDEDSPQGPRQHNSPPGGLEVGSPPKESPLPELPGPRVVEQPMERSEGEEEEKKAQPPASPKPPRVRRQPLLAYPLDTLPPGARPFPCHSHRSTRRNRSTSTSPWSVSLRLGMTSRARKDMAMKGS